MHIEIDSTIFKKALAIVQSLLTEHDVLTTADIDKQCLIIEAGASGIYIKQVLPAKVLSPGTLAFNSPTITSLYLTDIVTLKNTQNKVEFRTKGLKGIIEVNQDASKIEYLRPCLEIDTPTRIPRKMLATAIAKASFPTALQNGIRIKLDSYITTSATDQFRASLYKEKLGIAVSPFDILINPIFISKMLSKMDDPEVSFGVNSAIVKLESSSITCFFPTIQTVPDDVESGLVDISQAECLGVVETDIEQLLEAVLGASSIATAGYETRFVCKIHETDLQVDVSSTQGTASANVKLDNSTVNELSLMFNSRHIIDILNLIKTGKIKIQFFADYIIITGLDNRCINVIPTIAN